VGKISLMLKKILTELEINNGIQDLLISVLATALFTIQQAKK